MQPPKLVLPSAAMPWGRWVQDQEADADAKLARFRGDANSVGNQFASRADNVSKQIRGIGNVATITESSYAPFTRSMSGGTGTTHVLESPVYTITPPNQDSRVCSIVLNFVGTKTGGGSNLVSSHPLLKINGTRFGGTEYYNRRPPNNFDEMWPAMQGTVDVVPGAPVDVQFAIRSPWGSITVDFTDIMVWGLFYRGAN